MAREANKVEFLEQWLSNISGSSVANTLVKRNSAPSARAIVQAWSELRESLLTQKFDSCHFQALRTLVSYEATIHVADPQAKLVISILESRDLSLPPESYPNFVRLLYIWIRKSFRPSLSLVGLAMQALCGLLDDRNKITPSLVAQCVLVSGAFSCVPSLSGDSKFSCLEFLCGLLEEEYHMIGSMEELVPPLLAGVGYALSSSKEHYVRLLDILFGIWEKKDGPRGSLTHGLMILHLVEWVMSGLIRSNSVEKIMIFAKEVLEIPKVNYAVFAVLMAAAGVLRATRGFSGPQSFDVVSKLVNSAESRIEAVAQLVVLNVNSTNPTEVLLLKCCAMAMARSGHVSSSAPLLLCLTSALLIHVFPLDRIYESVRNSFGKDPIGPRLIWLNEHLSDVLFKESGAIAGALCNQYVSTSEENKSIVENLIWDFCQKLYSQHRQVALWLRGSDNKLLLDIEKIAESSFFMAVVFALAVTKQWLNPIVSEQRKRETSVKILISFSCVEYFRQIRLPEYMDAIREVIVSVQENDAACVSFVESIPAYESLTNQKDPVMLREPYIWSRDDVQTARILFYLRVIPTCIRRLQTSVFKRVVAPTMFLYMGHPNRKLAQASHSLFVAFVSGKDSEEDGRSQLKEQLVFYYMQRSLEVFPGLTPFEGMASGVAALVRHLPAGSPSIFYTVDCLIEKAFKFCEEMQNLSNNEGENTQGKKSDPCNQILELLVGLVSLVDIQVLPALMKSLAQLIVRLPKQTQNMVLDELYGQVAESDDVIRKPALVSWLQSVNYICSNQTAETKMQTSDQFNARL